MDIKKINLEFAHKDGFNACGIDKIRHIKTLPNLSIVQALEGNYDIKIGNSGEYNTGKSGFFIAPSNVSQTITHNTDKKSKAMTCRWVFLKIKINDLYDFDSLYDFPIIIPNNYKDKMNILFDELFCCERTFDEYVYYYKIVSLLHLMAREKKRQIPLQIENAINFIKMNYKENITVSDIANSINISQSHLFSTFKKEMGNSPIAYLNNYRLSMAADMLLNTEKSIVEISNSVGIGDSVYFNKLFKKTYQVSPKEYRKINKTDRV